MSNDIMFTKTINGTVYQVTLFTTKVDITVQKNLIVIPSYTGTANQDTKDPTDPDFEKPPRVVDLLNLQQRFDIEGYVDASTVSGDSSTTAVGRRDDLMNMQKAGGTLTMNYGGIDYTVHCEKIQATEESREEAIPTLIKMRIGTLKSSDIPARTT